MRIAPRPFFLCLAAGAVAVTGCKTTSAAAAPPKAAEPAVSPLSLSDLTATDRSLMSFTLTGTGKLAGMSGQTLAWTAKDDSGPIGSGSIPITVGPDGTFPVSFPVTIAKTLNDLSPFQDVDDIEVLVDAKVDGATVEKSTLLQSPHLPVPKVLTVQGTLSSPTTIDLTFLFGIENPNLFDVPVNGVTYKAWLGGHLVIDSQFDTPAALNHGERTEFTLPAQATPDNCGEGFKELAKAKTIDWRFAGTMHFPKFDMPFDLTGNLEITRTE